MKCSILVVLVLTAYLAEEVASQLPGAPAFRDNSCVAQCDLPPSSMSFFGGSGRPCRCDKSCGRENKKRNRGNVRRRPCCKDYALFCGNSCIPRCGQSYSPLFPCQCFDGCNKTKDNCCKDYKQRCVDKIMPTTKSIVEERNLAITIPPTIPPKEKGYSFMSGETVICPKGERFSACPINPCEVYDCPLYPDAFCRINECGKCSAIYSEKRGGEPLDCFDESAKCGNDQRIYDCGDIDLCKGATCPASPRATCVPSRCGGCYYYFVDGKGNIVNCEIELEIDLEGSA